MVAAVWSASPTTSIIRTDGADIKIRGSVAEVTRKLGFAVAEPVKA